MKAFCMRCGEHCEDYGTGFRLIPTGFVVYDPTSGHDVPELDVCHRCDIRPPPPLGTPATEQHFNDEEPTCQTKQT